MASQTQEDTEIWKKSFIHSSKKIFLIYTHIYQLYIMFAELRISFHKAFSIFHVKQKRYQKQIKLYKFTDSPYLYCHWPWSNLRNVVWVARRRKAQCVNLTNHFTLRKMNSGNHLLRPVLRISSHPWKNKGLQTATACSTSLSCIQLYREVKNFPGQTEDLSTG